MTNRAPSLPMPEGSGSDAQAGEALACTAMLLLFV